MLIANPAHRARAARLGGNPAACARPSTTSRRRANRCSRTSSAGCARRTRASSRREEPPRGADVGARAERRRVQRRGADPPLQRARDAAAAQAARWRAAPEDGVTAWSGWDVRSSRSSTATSSSTRWRAFTTGCGRTRAAGGELRHNGAGRAARPRADGAGAGAPTTSASDGASGGITGFVLVLDDITRRIETGNRRDLLLQTLTQGTRASLGSVRAAVETIAAFPEMDEDAQARFIGIIGDEARQLSAKLDADGRRVRRFAAHRVAARGHARRRPDRGGAAPHRGEARAADQARGRRRLDLAQRRQLLAAAGDDLPREPAPRGVRRPRSSLRAGPARARSRTSTSSGPARRSDPRRRWRGRPIRWSRAARRAR